MDAYSLGQFLRQARESKELELADAVAALRIRLPILEAFEAGEFDSANLSEIQLRGMLRIYARFLELDEEQALRQYDEMRLDQQRRGRWRLRRRSRRQAGELPMRAIDMEQRRAARRGGWWRVLLLMLASAVAVALIVYVTAQLVDERKDAEAGDGAGTQDASGGSSPAATSAPATATPTPIPPTPSDRAFYDGSGVLASLLMTQRNWIRVISDGIEVYAGIAAPGELLEYRALNEIIVSASNAMGLDVYWNGQRQQPFGDRGQRVDLRFGVDELTYSLGPAGAPTPISPTSPPPKSAVLMPGDGPEPSPSPSQTPAASDTPVLAPSQTFTPSVTPTASDTPTITPVPTETAILPPRVTQAGLPPTKAGARA